MANGLKRVGWPVTILAFAAVLGLLLMTTTRTPALVLADQAKFYLYCPTTEVREGDSVDVFLVRVTNHEHNVIYGAYWQTEEGTADASDYVYQYTDAIWGSESESLANRVKHTFETRQDSLVEGNETFTARFSPVDNVVDRNDPDRDERCEITIIDDDPHITDVEVTSSPDRDDTYGVGETIEVSATFSHQVEVDGDPGLGLWVGRNWRSAGYLRGSGSDTLVFGYKVKSEDRDVDGIRMDGGYKDSNDQWHNFINYTAVKAVGTDVSAYRGYSGMDDQSGHKVDGSLEPFGTTTEITSKPASGDEYRYGETVEFSITFSAALDVEGKRLLSLRVGSANSDGWRGAAYRSGSGTNTLTFGYTVGVDDIDTDGVTMLGTWTRNGKVLGFGGSGTIRVKDTDTVVTPTFKGLYNQSGHKINGRPYAKTIAITSTPVSRSDTYGRNEVIQVSVSFDQKVTASRTDYALLRIGSIWNQGLAAYATGSGTDTLVFEYTVLERDRDDNGVAAFLPGGLGIKAAGTDVGYQPDPGGEIPVMPEDASHRVDGRLAAADDADSG